MARAIVAATLAVGAAMNTVTPAYAYWVAQGAAPNFNELTLLATTFVILLGAGLMPFIAALGRLILKGGWAVTKMVIFQVLAELLKWLVLGIMVLFGLGFAGVYPDEAIPPARGMAAPAITTTFSH
jgi:hypothetical protein